MFDVIIAGGGPAGLSAALMLGRCRRRVLVCDEGTPRNRWSHALHGYLTRDGIAPLELNRIGRRELATYGVDLKPAHVRAVERIGSTFRVSTDSEMFESRYVLIATGVADDVPTIPGLSECYGRSVFHCPYCDGWEQRDRRIGVVGPTRSAIPLAMSLTTWSPHVALLTNGVRLGMATLGRVGRNGVQVETARIDALEHDHGALSRVRFRNGQHRELDALFFTAGQHPRCDLASSLGCAFNRKGTVKTTLTSATNVPGVFVAGDASHDAQFAIVAAAEGVKAAVAINQALQEAEFRL